MKTIVDQLARAAKHLSEATERALASAEKEARVRPVPRGERRKRDRNQIHDVIALREELENIKLRVAHNARQLEIQFARLAEMQVEINQLTGKKAARFRG